eukprot:CAMPEP_0117544766 /NCGR_PEP_ID=MMETSP0784-20121206/45747_1 /TAXON_ID=39447 /ORGANISM="" /LENGTH=216 /DNA_ID=CAMNT_0005341589 /DNA_START=492 /DNA_END=1144 /DNA_ORIENTATION=+
MRENPNPRPLQQRSKAGPVALHTAQVAEALRAARLALPINVAFMRVSHSIQDCHDQQEGIMEFLRLLLLDHLATGSEELDTQAFGRTEPIELMGDFWLRQDVPGTEMPAKSNHGVLQRPPWLGHGASKQVCGVPEQRLPMGRSEDAEPRGVQGQRQALPTVEVDVAPSMPTPLLGADVAAMRASSMPGGGLPTRKGWWANVKGGSCQGSGGVQHRL